MIQTGWALEEKHLDLDGSIGIRVGFRWAVSYTLVKSIVFVYCVAVNNGYALYASKGNMKQRCYTNIPPAGPDVTNKQGNA